MSAAEKLKALEVKANGPQTYCPEPREEEEAAAVLLDALPQIVAVVEAAEEAVPRLREDRGGFAEWAKAKGALAALDKALS